MTIQEQLFDWLAGTTAAGERLYPQIAPDGVIKPYAVYRRIASAPENVLAGSSGLTNSRIQIDVYASTYAQSQSVAHAIALQMANWSIQNVCLGFQDFYEEDAKLHRVMTDFSVWHG